MSKDKLPKSGDGRARHESHPSEPTTRQEYADEPMSESLGRVGSAIEGIISAILAVLGIAPGSQKLSRALEESLRRPEIEEAILLAKRQGSGAIYIAQGKVAGQPALLILHKSPGGSAKIVEEIELDVKVRDWPETGSPEAMTWRLDEINE